MPSINLLHAAVLALVVCAGCGHDWDRGLADHSDGGATATDEQEVVSQQDSGADLQTDGGTSTGSGVAKACPSGWCTIQAGVFTMGSLQQEDCREPGSGPRDGVRFLIIKETAHSVELTHAFDLAAQEVTQEAFQQRMGSNPSGRYFSAEQPAPCANCPVDSVTWDEAVAYCNGLTQRPEDRCYSCGIVEDAQACESVAKYAGSAIYDCPGFRLPTEAEWEYAYRAGHQTPLHQSRESDGSISSCDGPDVNASRIGWYLQNSGGSTHPVGDRQPNGWGLYDMAGNVSEFCHDGFDVDLESAARLDPVSAGSNGSHVLRGGSAWSWVESVRAAARSSAGERKRFPLSGFRCARSRD